MRANKVKRVCQEAAGIDKVDIKFFGYKLLLQPLDQVFSHADDRIIQRLQEEPIKWLNFAATEFLVIVRR